MSGRPPRVGFVILSHTPTRQLHRLIAALTREYNAPPIAIHHDFLQSSLDTTGLDGCDLVRPSHHTRWADVSIVHAFRSGLALLYDKHDPDWFVLLSATDYPVRSGPQVTRELSDSPYDAYLSFVPATRTGEVDDPDGTMMGCRRSAWSRMAYERYVAKTVRYPSITKHLRPTTRAFTVRSFALLRHQLPFSSSFRCYGGDFWLTATRRAASLLRDDSENVRRLLNHYTGRVCPDESFQHSVLCNASGLRIANGNRRFTSWPIAGGHHPDTLTMEHLREIRESGCHFARKFSLDEHPAVLDAIDEMCLGR